MNDGRGILVILALVLIGGIIWLIGEILRLVLAMVAFGIVLGLGGGILALAGLLTASVSLLLYWQYLRFSVLTEFSAQNMTGSAVLTHQGQQIAWTANPQAAAFQVREGFIEGFGIAAGTLGVILAGFAFASAGWFGNIEKGSIKGDHVVLIMIALVGICIVAGVIHFLREPVAARLQGWLLGAVNRWLADINNACADALEELRQIETEIRLLWEEIGVEIALTYEGDLQQQPADQLSMPGGRDPFLQRIAAAQERALRDRNALAAAVTDYQAADAAFAQAEAAVRNAGGRVLHSRLNELHEGLYSEALSSLLSEGQWEDFRNITGGIRSELETLAADAAAGGGRGWGRWRRESKGTGSQTKAGSGPMTVARAFDVLGLPPTADAARIKQAYRFLASAWHPDTGGVSNDDRIKDINAAFECLRKAGHVQ